MADPYSGVVAQVHCNYHRLDMDRLDSPAKAPALERGMKDLGSGSESSTKAPSHKGRASPSHILNPKSF